MSTGETVTKVGVVLTFKEGTDLERVQRWVERLEEAGHLESSTVREFESHYGEGPVFYIP